MVDLQEEGRGEMKKGTRTKDLNERTTLTPPLVFRRGPPLPPVPLHVIKTPPSKQRFQ